MYAFKGCTSQNGVGFAVELAKKKFHLILVDSNKILLTKLADFLGILEIVVFIFLMENYK